MSFMKDFSNLKKRELIIAFVMNLNMIDSVTPEGRVNIIENLEAIQDAYTGKRGYAALENEMMKQEIRKAKSN